MATWIILTLLAAGVVKAPPDVARIMHEVAENQAKSQDLRRNFIYTQKQLLRMIRANGKLAREERREYTIVPKDRHSERIPAHFEGRYAAGNGFVAYDKPGYEYNKVDIDGGLINSMSEDLMDDGNSKDGIGPDLFPLTYHQQLKYDFRLAAVEAYRGRAVYRVAFAPQKGVGLEDGDWKGEALIDAEEFQPVLVTTSLAWKMPLAVQILLGTNIRGLGFSVSYQKFADKVWFPVSYGGEFEVRGLFLYRRTITIALTNSNFQRTDVTSNVAYGRDDQ
ncbi:MAG: hypothetical protein ABSH45_20505 [Bryobacteraceae bacterium]|jgi:hypothetical protein